MNTGCIFTGKQLECKAFLRSHNSYYIYILRRPDGRPFYIGKGLGDRAFHHENESRHANDRRSNAYKLNVIRSILSSRNAIIYEIDSLHDTEAGAHQREMQLIRAIGRLHEGGPLTNLAAGGGSERGPAPVSKAKHRATLSGSPDDNPERSTINSFITGISPMNSVVVKPVSQFIPRLTQVYPSKSMNPSVRQAVAIVASAASNGVVLQEGCVVPRKLVIENVSGMIENGVSCDIVTSKLGILLPAETPSEECFSLTSQQVGTVINLIGRQKCIDLGVLRPASETLAPQS